MARTSNAPRFSSRSRWLSHIVLVSLLISDPCSSFAKKRVRSTTRAKRLPVPRDKTEDALVKTAGAAIKVSTAKGLSDTGVTITLQYAALSNALERTSFGSSLHRCYGGRRYGAAA